MYTAIEYRIVDFSFTPTEQQLNSLGQDGWRLATVRDMVDKEGNYKAARCVFLRRKHDDQAPHDPGAPI